MDAISACRLLRSIIDPGVTAAWSTALLELAHEDDAPLLLATGVCRGATGGRCAVGGMPCGGMPLGCSLCPLGSGLKGWPTPAPPRPALLPLMGSRGGGRAWGRA